MQKQKEDELVPDTSLGCTYRDHMNGMILIVVVFCIFFSLVLLFGEELKIQH